MPVWIVRLGARRRPETLAVVAPLLCMVASGCADAPRRLEHVLPMAESSSVDEEVAPSQPRVVKKAPPVHPGARHALARASEVDVKGRWSCTFAAIEPTVRFSGSLAFDDKSDPFVDIEHPATVVARLDAETQVYGVDIEVSGVFLRGFTTIDTLPLYLQQPTLFDGWVVPYANARLALKGAGENTLAVKLGPFAALDGTVLAKDVQCDEVGLSTRPFDARARFSYAKKFGSLADRTIPISMTPGGPSVGRLVPSEGPENSVDVLEIRDDQARIVWATNEVVVSGWIPKADVTIGDVGDSFGAGGLGLSGIGAGGLPSAHTCQFDLTLRASVGGVQRVVGYVKRDTPMIEGGRDGAMTAITFLDDAIAVRPNAVLLVESALLEACPRF